MKTNRFVSMSFAALLLIGTSGAALAQATDDDHDAHHPEQTEQAPAAQPNQPDAPEGGMPGMMGQGMMGRGMSMNPDMMRMMQRMMRTQQDDDGDMSGMGMPGMMGMMGRGMMRHDHRHAGMMRLIFILMDADGDGALSLDEVQAVTERIFNAIDADDDGQVTLDEIREFYRGPERADRRMPMRDRMPMREGMQMRDGMQMGAASQAYMGAMQTMMEDMAGMEMTGDPARDFALMMIPHHQSAIDMAEALLQHSDDPELTQLANEIIAEQRREIEVLENWLAAQDQ
jgi:Ca2+-binding EF-hand superfamily protein